MTSTVSIAERAWRKICAEVNHFANDPDGSKEMAVYPLIGFIRHASCKKAPWEMLEHDDLSEIVVPDVFVPPRNACEHGYTRAGFAAGVFDDEVNTWAAKHVARSPGLDIGYVHAHQFARGWTQPSATDRARVAILQRHLMERCVAFAPEIIVCQAKDGPECWTACCFTLDAEGRVRSLGRARIVSDTSPSVCATTANDFTQTLFGRSWTTLQRLFEPRIESIDRYYLGWHTLRIRLEHMHIFVHLPPDFPDSALVLYQSYDHRLCTWQSMQTWEERDMRALDVRSIIAAVLASKHGGLGNDR